MKFFPLIILILTISPYGLNAMHTPDHKQIVLAHMAQMHSLDRDKVQNQHYYQKNLGHCWWDWDIMYWQCN